MTHYELTWGVLAPGTFERVVVFSPHFDDAAMGAGHFLLAHPGATVCTALGSAPRLASSMPRCFPPPTLD